MDVDAGARRLIASALRQTADAASAVGQIGAEPGQWSSIQGAQVEGYPFRAAVT